MRLSAPAALMLLVAGTSHAAEDPGASVPPPTVPPPTVLPPTVPVPIWDAQLQRPPFFHSAFGPSLALGSEGTFYSERRRGLPAHGWGGWTRLELAPRLDLLPATRWGAWDARIGVQLGAEYFRGVPFAGVVESSLLSLLPEGRVTFGLRRKDARFRAHVILSAGARHSRVRVWSADNRAPTLTGNAWNGMAGLGLGIGGTLAPKELEWSLSAEHRWSGRARFDHEQGGAATILPSARVRALYVEAGLGFSFY